MHRSTVLQQACGRRRLAAFCLTFLGLKNLSAAARLGDLKAYRLLSNQKSGIYVIVRVRTSAETGLLLH